MIEGDTNNGAAPLLGCEGDEGRGGEQRISPKQQQKEVHNQRSSGGGTGEQAGQ